MQYSITTVATPELDLAEIVALAARLGYDGIELRVRRLPEPIKKDPFRVLGNYRYDVNPDNLADEAPKIRLLCREHGLMIPAITANATLTDLEDIRRLSEGAAMLECPLLRLAPPARYDGSVRHAALVEQTIEALGRAIEVMRPFDVRALIEIHSGYIAPSVSTALRLVSPFDPSEIGIIYDVQHIAREGYEGIRLGLDTLGPYLAHVHVSGHAPRPTNRDERGAQLWTWQATDLQDCFMPIPSLLAELKRIAYDRFITVEDLRNEVTTEKRFAPAIKFLRDCES